MSSFQAALHIIKPLDEGAWEMLKPRLLSQRADAQKREEERHAQAQAIEDLRKERSNGEQQQDAKEQAEYENAQVVVRSRISAYADEVIRDGWASGAKVDNQTSAHFAAEVLIYVRKRFYAEVAKDDAAARAAGKPLVEDPKTGPLTRKLTLEDMRWVFETKIRPHTDKFRKELFLCNGCDSMKWYAFEGVCQHYASKHTSNLSSGSVVVHWRAEWPEEPPFNPEPHLPRAAAMPATSAPELFPNGVPAPAPTIGFPPQQEKQEPEHIFYPASVSTIAAVPATYPPPQMPSYPPIEGYEP